MTQPTAAQDAVAKLWARSAREDFRQKMGIEVMEIAPGYAKTAMDFSPELTNIYGMLHGGAIFSLLDEAFQLACNAHGEVAVALQISIYYLAPPQPGVKLLAEARESSATRKTALYDALVWQEDGKRIARGQALAYRKGQPLPLDMEGNLLDKASRA